MNTMTSWLVWSAVSGTLLLSACSSDQGNADALAGNPSTVAGTQATGVGGVNTAGSGTPGLGTGGLGTGGASMATPSGVPTSGGAATTATTSATMPAGGTPSTGGAGSATRAGGATSTGGAGTATRAGGATSTGGAGTATRAGGATSTGGAPSTGGATSTGTCAKFSFFVSSMARMISLSGNTQGFGGDLRYGQADGLTGADKICKDIATQALACAGNKTWKAFLSTATVDAIDRIGTGPWYDRVGRLVWNNKAEMAQDRPPSAPAIIKDDLPNEDGVPNHDYDQTGSTTDDDDNHDVLTGSGPDGRKIASDTAAHRCNDWTSLTATPASTGGGWGFFEDGPMCGHSWPRDVSGVNWASSIREGGCARGINLKDDGGAMEPTVGSGGGYGAIYCFALTP